MFSEDDEAPEETKAGRIGSIVVAAHHYAQAEDDFHAAVAKARAGRDGLSWAEVGLALGISAQAAHERFGKPRGRSGTEVKLMVAMIPKSVKGSGNVDQSNFKMALAGRLAAGESKDDALKNATSDVRKVSASFEPAVPTAFYD